MIDVAVLAMLVFVRLRLRRPRRFDDQPGAALEGHVFPQPVKGDAQPIASADEKIHMRDAPEQPGKESLKAQPADGNDGRLTADGGKIPIMAIGKWAGLGTAGNARGYEAADIAAHLLASGCDAGHGPVIFPANSGDVADREYIGMARHGEIWIDLDAAGAIARNPDPGGGARGFHPSGPDIGGRVDALAARRLEAPMIAGGDHSVGPDVNTHARERSLRIGGEVFGQGRQYPRACLEQHDVRGAGID